MPALIEASIELILAHQAPSGAFPACPTFPTYRYCWLRDGTWIAHALDAAGQQAPARAFHRWVGQVVRRHAPKVERFAACIAEGRSPGDADVLHTRFTLEGEEASEPWRNFQLDGYGTWLWGLVDHVERWQDRELLGQLEDAVDLVVRYLLAGWQVPCRDCWEEFPDKVHPATLACICGGLEAVHRHRPRADLAETSRAIRSFILDHAVADGRIAKFVGSRSVDASLLWLAVPFGVLPCDDLLMVETVRAIEEHLLAGGVARYPDDTYYGGGRWLLLSAWLGWYHAERGDLGAAARCLAWVEAQADEDGWLPEQVAHALNAPLYYPRWVQQWGPIAKPLLWSHAMYVVLHRRLADATAGAANAGRSATLYRIEHRPAGLGDPYRPLVTQRLPVDPLAGQAVLVRFRVQPLPGDAVQGQVIPIVNGRPLAACCARRLRGAEERWEAELGPFAAGDQVSYTIRISDAAGRAVAEAGPFAFAVGGWAAPRVTGWRAVAGGAVFPLALHDGGQHALAVTFPAPRTVHFRWSGPGAAPGSPQPIPPTASNQPDPAGPRRGAAPRITATDDAVAICEGDVCVEIARQPLRIRVTVAGRRILDSPACPGEPALRYAAGGAGHPDRLHLQWACRPDERFYGLGERFDALDQRGRIVHTYVYNQYLDQGNKSYLPVPFYLSSAGYGLLLEVDAPTRFDMAAGTADRVRITTCAPHDAPEVGWYVFCEDRPLANIRKLAEATHLPSLPPPRAFGPWMSSNPWDSQSEVRRQVEQSKALDIPATVIVLEAWSDESTFYIFNDAQYRPRPGHEAFRYEDFTFPPHGRWPDPRALVADLHREGMRVLLWQVPILKALPAGRHRQRDLDEAYMIEAGYCARNADGSPYRCPDGWFRGSLLLDFTNPEAVDWWLNRRAYLLADLGVDGFKTDGGEFVWGRDVRFADGSDGVRMRNRYPNVYVQAYHRFVTGRGDGITFSRAGYTGAQAYPLHWAGDERSTFAAFRHSLVAGLSAGMSGIPFWGWDLAGFSGEIPSSELYMRAAAMAAFCPVMQYHAESRGAACRDRTPWNIAERTGDERVVAVYRRLANLRLNLLPYIYQEAWHASEAGEPLMRAMWLEFPDDPACAAMWHQYCFGRALLVAPVLWEGAREREVYLPAGSWFDLWTGQPHTGPATLTVACPIDHIPVFVRGGHALAVRPNERGELFSGMRPPVRLEPDGLVFHVYPEKGPLRCSYRYRAGSSTVRILSILVERRGETWESRLEADPASDPFPRVTVRVREGIDG